MTLLHTLTEPAVLASFFGGALLQTTTFYLARPFIPSKQQAWILTLISSLVMSIGSLPFLYALIAARLDVTHLPADSPFARGLVAFFESYLALDLILGCIHYRTAITLVTGWFHHLSYGCVLLWVLHNAHSPLFCLMTILEMPTILLAVGHLDKRLRNDTLFAALFFVTRIVFHLCMTHAFYSSLPVRAVWKISAFFFPLHIHWFYKIVKLQIRLARERREREALLQGAVGWGAVRKGAPLPYITPASLLSFSKGIARTAKTAAARLAQNDVESDDDDALIEPMKDVRPQVVRSPSRVERWIAEEERLHVVRERMARAQEQVARAARAARRLYASRRRLSDLFERQAPIAAY
ncbi:uncharacterized protein VTP21DRAFT_2681 [Calcarisporiella thermophila]|uniref:uncharacterized protein n=1 Tax=Calcarisporiella thermophila TaxID=911321 RepID=UPI003742395C